VLSGLDDDGSACGKAAFVTANDGFDQLGFPHVAANFLAGRDREQLNGHSGMYPCSGRGAVPPGRSKLESVQPSSSIAHQ
jgi:hypothetical protein